MAAFAAASAALECGSLLPLFYSVAQKRQFTAASSFCGSAVTLPKSGSRLPHSKARFARKSEREVARHGHVYLQETEFLQPDFHFPDTGPCRCRPYLVRQEWRIA